MGVGFLCVPVVVVFSLLLIDYIAKQSDEKRIKENRKREISRIQSNVIYEFDYLENVCKWPLEEVISGLERYAERIKTILSDESIQKILKPYDVFYRTGIKKNSNLHGAFKIVIDKNLVPKFAPELVRTGTNETDIELEACMDINKLEEFIKKCKRIIMDKKIEEYRKKKVEDKLK